MDRLREANRRGSLSGGAQISSLRRPRSGGFKDSTVLDEDESMEDIHSARLRERPRKEGSILSASRHKRTRHTSRELHSRIGVVEEAQGSEIGASDEDDDVPISPNLLPRKPAKLRFHGKVTSEEGNAVEIPTVPRKARTAISKRPHESLQGDITRQHSHAYAPQSSALAVPLFTPPGPALKPMKRMKHNGPKVKAAKHTKVSASVSISEQEVEVAEALFDLARMVSNMGSPLCNDDTKEVKMENGELKGAAWLTSPESTPIRRQDSISTPPSSHSAVSSPVHGPAPVTSLYIPASEAPTRKISLSKLKIEDGTHSQLKNDLIGPVKGVSDSTGQSVGLKITSTNDNGIIGQGPHHNAAAPNSVPNQFSQTSNINISVTDDKTSLYPKIPLDSALGSDAPSKSDASFLTACLDQKQECGKEHKTPACGIIALSKEKKLKTSYPCKYEIDLMASPTAAASGATEKNGSNLDFTGLGPNKLLQEWEKDSYTNNEKHDGQTSVDASTVKEEGISSGNEKEARKSIKLNEHVKEENSREYERDQQVVKQEFLATFKNNKPDLMKQHTSDASGWPGNFPHMGYYPSAAAAAAAAAAVAAAWPAPGSVIGAVSMEEKGHPGLQVPPFAFPSARPLCKRCTTHVYIAHFIDTQQQMQRHPIWAPGGLYSMKPYNINAPLPPNTLFGGGLSGLTGLSVNNSPANKGFNPESSPQNDKSSAPGPKEKSTSLNMDGVDRKRASQSSQAGNMDQVTPLQAGLGPMFGYPLVGPSSVSADTEGNNVLNKGSSTGGATAAVASHLELAGASTSNTDSVNVASAQVQYLQAIIQQAGFPFSFSPGHLMPPTTGHMTQQQATQFYGNPFYNAPFVQQGSATGRITPKMSSPQGQNTSMHQDARVSHAVSQQHQQQQQQHSSASSSQSHQRIASQHLQHFGDLGGEAVSSAESKFPGYQKNMQSHEASIMHASNISSASSLHTAGMPVLPAHVSLAAKQVANMKLPLPQSCGQGQVQQHLIPQYHSMGVKSMDFQSPQGSSSMLPGAVSKNMIGPGPLGLAPVAAVMAPQGHTVLQTMADAQLSHHAYQEQSLQQTYSKFTTNANLEGSKTSAEMSDEKRTPVKQAAASCTSKMDIESDSSSRGSLSGLTSVHMQQNFPGVSFNFMTSPVDNCNLGSRQGAPVSVAPVSIGNITGAVPSSRPVAVARANTLSNMTATAHESTALNKSTSSNVSFHVPSVSGHHGIRQGQAASQYTSQSKPVSRTQPGTTCVSTTPSPLLPGSYAGVPNTKQLGYSAKNQQASMSSMQSRFPPTASGSSSAPASPSTSISKANSSAAVKNTLPGKGSLNSSQKQAPATFGKKPDAILTHSPGQVVGPNSMTVSMSQQQQQSQHQQLQHTIKQQHQWQQQQKQHHNLHQEHSQQGPQNMHHQVHVAGVPPTVTVQYHQASGTNQVGQAGVQKQSAQPQQVKQCAYLEQHFYQQQLQQQSQLTEPQHSARPSTQQHSAQRPVVVATNRPTQQPPELQHQQANKHQAVSSHQQPFSLASFGTSSSGAVPHTSSISTGNGSVGRPASSDGALMQVISPKANTGMKPPGGMGASVTGSNLQRSSTPSSGISHVQGMGAKLTDAKLQPQPSSNISYLPYLHSATFSSAAATVGKSHGASFMHSQSGASVKSTRDPSAGAGREDNSTMHQFNDRAFPASIAPLTSGNSHSSPVSATTNVKSSISQLNTDVKAASRTTPLVLHGLSDSHVATTSGQSSQTCTVTSASMTADSISTTG